MNNNNTDMIWYASYGSNMSLDRFLCYIKGGKPKYSCKKYLGCKDNSDPQKECSIDIPYEIYFSNESETWCGGAVAFIESQKKDIITFGRAYLISAEQFLDVVRQENGKKPGDSKFTFDIQYALTHEQSFLNTKDPSKPANIKEPKWYGRILNIDNIDGYPVLTFTAEWPDKAINTKNSPSRSYLKTISNGIKETYNKSTDEIIEYLITKRGIKEFLNMEILRKWIT